jgi:isoprenylcysteine carboxyl methyltransferase
MSFLFNNFSLWNIIVFTLLYLFQFLRIIYEEQVLSQNEQYREYKTRVKYRFIPFII